MQNWWRATQCRTWSCQTTHSTGTQRKTVSQLESIISLWCISAVSVCPLFTLWCGQILLLVAWSGFMKICKFEGFKVIFDICIISTLHHQTWPPQLSSKCLPKISQKKFRVERRHRWKTFHKPSSVPLGSLSTRVIWWVIEKECELQ